ncbi:MAG: hypothetical protein ACYCZ0_00150 [Minisyncoccota bacterium]
MGGKGSGGHNRLSDAEKRARGTHHADQTEEIYAARAAEKVVVGPWLISVPEPTLPLDEIGRAAYDKFTKILFDQNKLTTVTCGDCERLAVMQQQAHARLTAGKPVSMDLIKRMDSISVRLRIAENAPAIANQNQKNRFEGSGFSNNRASPIRLRPYSAAGKGEL